ncbi:MAG: hypothetical protein HN929_11755 [Chloroflexi bacterium]|nr:hypothetical protein [Chloroflexota bacterium]
MRLLIRLIVWLILLSPFALATSVWFALEDAPSVSTQRQLSHQDIARARTIIRRNDPRQFPIGSRQTVLVNQGDLNLAANYLLQQLGGAASIDIRKGSAELDVTTRVPMLAVRPYLNINLTVDAAGGVPRFRGLRIGRLQIPDLLTSLLGSLALRQVYNTSQFQLAKDVVQDLDFKPGSASITYVWRPRLIERAIDSLLGLAVSEALTVYHNHLAGLHANGVARRGSVVGVLKPLFQEAERRSRTNDPVDENRALLLVLGAWVNARGMDKLVPQVQRKGQLKSYRLSLYGRKDFGQHFLTSAALVSAGDTSLSDAIGLFKEIKDANDGSGFSFNDLAADRAGTRFGELATGSNEQARRVQKLLAAGIREQDIMPGVRDLPEYMGQKEFMRRFGGVGSQSYNQLRKEIERRIAACRLYSGI